MKKIILILMCAVLFVFTASCDTSSPYESNKDDDKWNTGSLDSDVEEEIEDTENETECEHVLKESVYKEPNYGIDGVNYVYCTLCDHIDYKKVPALPSVFELTVTDKSTLIEENDTDGSKKCWVVLNIDIKNISDKNIKTLSGHLVITGMGGIFDLNCDFGDINLKAYETINYANYVFSFDYASLPTDLERKVYDTPYEDLVSSFSPSDISVEESAT